MQSTVNVRFRTALFWVCIAALVVLSFMILRPFIIPIVSAFVLAYLARPIYKRISKASNPHIAAAVTIILALAIVITPIALISSALISQVRESLDAASLGNAIVDKVSSIAFLDKFNIDLSALREKALTFLMSMVTGTITQIPSVVISLIITLLGTYYMLVNWDMLVGKIREFIPFKNKDSIMSGVALATKNIIYGYILIAIIEFAVASIGFYIAGIDGYLLLPALIAMLAFIPGAGPALVWVPTFLVTLVNGSTYSAIVVLITGLIITVLIETLLYGRIVGKRAAIHPLVMLIGILGGVPLFGIFGFIIGPLILAYTLRILEESLSGY